VFTASILLNQPLAGFTGRADTLLVERAYGASILTVAAKQAATPSDDLAQGGGGVGGRTHTTLELASNTK
jgi:hypothetical protein